MKERNCTPDKPKNHIPDWVLRQFETDECRIAELEAEVARLNAEPAIQAIKRLKGDLAILSAQASLDKIENDRLTKRCEVATVWMEHYTSCEKFFEDEDDDDECTCGLDEWLDEGKP